VRRYFKCYCWSWCFCWDLG